MMQEKLKEIRDLLTEVKYPGTSKNIVELDMVQNIRIEGEKVLFRLVFQKASDPFVGSVKKKAEALIKEKTSYTEVEIENLFVQDLERPLSLEKVKNIIAVSSGKGGVGKSTVAANLAVALAAEGYKVGLVDADIFGPSIPKMFGCEEAQPYMEQIDGKDFIVPVEKYGVKLLSIGFFVDPASATVWRGPMASILSGAGGFKIFFKITFPQIKWALIYGIILCTSRALGEFGAVNALSKTRGETFTLPLEIDALYMSGTESSITAAFAASSILVIIAVVVLVLRNILEYRAKKKGQEQAAS